MGLGRIASLAGGTTTLGSASLGLLIARIVGGATMLIAHGLPKLTTFSEKSSTFPDPLGIGSSTSLALAVGAEVGCALLLILGLFTRAALVPLIITMVVAFFLVHGADPFARRELAFLYLGLYLALFVTGAGRFSLDALIARR